MSPKEKTEDAKVDGILLAITKKVIIPLLLALTVTGIGWIAKSVNGGISDIKVISANLSNATEDIEKLSSRYEDINEKYSKLENHITELKVRLEMAKLESMETALLFKEQVEILEKYAEQMKVFTGPNKFKDLREKPSYSEDFDGLEDRVLEQRKVIERLKPAE